MRGNIIVRWRRTRTSLFARTDSLNTANGISGSMRPMQKGPKPDTSFPFGDFKNVHRCGLLAVKSRAHQFGYADIEKAATQLIEIINSKKENQPGAEHRLPVCAPTGVTLR